MSNLAKSRKKLFALVAVLVTAVALPAAAAIFIVYPPGSLPLLRPYSAHAADWWRWAGSLPLDRSPLIDNTGANCAQGQSGLTTWYLAPTFGSTATRSCSIPGGRTLVFPIMNAFFGAYPFAPAELRTEAYVRSRVEWIEDATDLVLEIDGDAVPNIDDYLERSSLFSLTVPANNIFGEPAGRVLNPSVDSGYYVAIAPLLPGNHTIHFHGRVPEDEATGQKEYVVDVTYNLNVRLLPF